MPSIATPFGLKAKSHPSGVIRPQRYVVPAGSTILTNSASNIYQDDAVYIDTNGAVQLSGAVGTGPTSPATGPQLCLGAFQGVEFNDSNGRRTVSNQFNRSTVYTPTANTGLGTTDVWFWIYMDPDITYEIQAAGSLTQGAIGNVYGFDQNAGAVNSVVGFSAGRMTTTAATAGQTGPFIVYNLAYDNTPVNTYTPGVNTTGNSANTENWGSAFTNVLVRLANPQYSAGLGAGY